MGIGSSRQPSTPADRYAAKLRMLEFQAALRASDMDTALSADFTDNALLPAEGALNVFRLWSEIKNPSEHNYDYFKKRGQIVKLYKLLRKSVNIEWLNRRDPTDGARPIDVAGKIQLTILLEYRVADRLDCNPTDTNFPLCRCLTVLQPDRICEMIDAMDPETLDCCDPSTATTPLCTVVILLSATTKDNMKGQLRILVKLAGKIPYVNPFHPCFEESTVESTSDGVEIIRVMRLEFAAYRRKLPLVVAANLMVAIPSVVVAIIVGYIS